MTTVLAEKAEAYINQLEEAPALDSANTTALLQKQNKVLRKIDLRLTPLFFVVYLITFIDRASIGNARVGGLEKDLGLVGYQFNIILSCFYITYALWEMPSNLVRTGSLGPKIWLPLQIVSFGVVSMATAFVKNFAGLVVLRVVLGLAEGGVLPCMALVLSRFYTRKELILRVAYMVSAASLAGAFGGLLSSGFISIGPLAAVGNAAWRNIFFFEGIITIAIGIVVYFLCPSSPEDALFLTAEERVIARERLGTRVSSNISPAVKRRLTRQGFLALPTWLCAFGYLGTNVSVQGVSLFLPTIIRALYPGLPTVQIQLRTVPPYVVAFAWTLALAWLSSRIDRRGLVLLATSPFAIAGYIIFVVTGLSDVNARYAGSFLCILGAFPLGPFTMAWAMNNAATDIERGVAGGLVPGFGQLGAIIATWSYLPKDAPNYYTGNSINIGFASFCWLISASTLVYLIYQNRARRAGKMDYRLSEVPDSEDPTEYLGSKHPSFIYSL
ncbi:major facilitator superfamily domain-containing protein [Leucosporidium creatinivorum]|uniref:Major facilitator superfamily domain-containing protein n=1 Tax=Leucosporidium creatinivorum TaxID=106004 RepID=A0A1Y2EWS6_9BASI|nr:major facilitator superfamily domain-containing protein [Leucosporidium creatinivorum]